MQMSLEFNLTPDLWKLFMTHKHQLHHLISDDLYSLQVYPADYFLSFNPSASFTKWALTEVSSFEDIDLPFETFVLPEGLYAVFHHRGNDTGVFQEIYNEWLPNSGFELDDRPHFELLGKNYKRNSADSEEKIFIPLKAQ